MLFVLQNPKVKPQRFEKFKNEFPWFQWVYCCSRRPICPLSIPLISLCVPRGPCVASLEGASGPKDLSLSVCVCVYWRVAERHLVSRVWDRKPKEGLRRMPGHFRVSVNCQYILSHCNTVCYTMAMVKTNFCIWVFYRGPQVGPRTIFYL